MAHIIPIRSAKQIIALWYGFHTPFLKPSCHLHRKVVHLGDVLCPHFFLSMIRRHLPVYLTFSRSPGLIFLWAMTARSPALALAYRVTMA